MADLPFLQRYAQSVTAPQVNINARRWSYLCGQWTFGCYTRRQSLPQSSGWCLMGAPICCGSGWNGRDRLCGAHVSLEPKTWRCLWAGRTDWVSEGVLMLHVPQRRKR